MKYIQLTQGKTTVVDDRDYPALSVHKWYADKNRRTFYATRWAKDGKVYMHRTLLGLKKGELCDHKNKDGLDNRRENLRKVSYVENGLNRRLAKNNTSGVTGVCWDKSENKWRVDIMVAQKSTFLGYFMDKIKAIQARKSAEDIYWTLGV